MSRRPSGQYQPYMTRRRSSIPNPTVELLKEEVLCEDHFLSPSQLEVVYRTDIDVGLTSGHAAELLLYNGPNTLKQDSGVNYCAIFKHNLFGWFACFLWFGAILNYITYFCADLIDSDAKEGKDEYLYLGVVITFTILSTGFYGFYQEAKNASVFSGFENLVPPATFVMRDGQKIKIPNADVVIGDIVEMSGGEIVPADVRIIECNNFSSDMSSLTGESKPISHTTNFTNANPLESKNMAYFSCPITEGYAKGIVVATGENTQIGRIAGLVSGLKKDETPISKEITHFVIIICGLSFGFGAIFFVMVYYVQRSWVSALQYMLGIILANVPEGLIVTLTVCMTLSANRLKSKNCYAKTLQAVETLGSTSCICSDKTGTLTANNMSVSHLFCNNHIYDKSDHSEISDPAYMQLGFAASLNLKAFFTRETADLDEVEKRTIIGDASERAILSYMEVHRSATKLQAENPKVAEIPFNSSIKYQVTIHLLQNQTHYLIIKGAPEIVIEFCNRLTLNGIVLELTPILKKELKGYFIKMANMGERVIAYGDLHLDASYYPPGFKFNTTELNFPLTNLQFIGAISMIDPPRENIRKCIDTCRAAGIKVIMVTGDHPVTALAISHKIGTITQKTAYDYALEQHIEVSDIPWHIRNQFKAAIITGDDLRRMAIHDLRWAQKTFSEITFARTSPQQKLYIVENYQALGYIVAVTGDGVNDSPALKKADIGIAMGITGTEVSRQAADMILMDDNFASIVVGIEEGRRIFDNLKKTIAYTLTSNTPEMIPFVLYALAGMPLPVTLILILIVNVGTDLLPAMSLAYEESEGDVMNLPPRRVTDRLVNNALIFMAYFQIGLIQFCAGMYCYFVIFASNNFLPKTLINVRQTWDSEEHIFKDSLGNPWTYAERKVIERKAQTAYFVAVCFTQIADVIICKTRRISLITKGMNNWILNVSIFIDFLVALVVTYVPVFNSFLGTSPIHWGFLFLSLPFMLLMILGDEFRRYIIRHNFSKWVEKELYY